MGYNIAHIVDNQIVGLTSEDYKDENNWYRNIFMGDGYLEIKCKNGTRYQRFLTIEQNGAKMGIALKIMCDRLSHKETSKEIIEESEKLDSLWRKQQFEE